MKFAMYTGFSQMIMQSGIEQAAKYAAELGFSGVEFFADGFDQEHNSILNVEEAVQAKEVLDRYGLSVVCYSVYIDLWRNRKGEEFLRKQVEAAAALGSPYFHHTLLPWIPYPENAPDQEEAIAEIVEAAFRIADYAKPFGITCIYEDQGYYVNGVDGFGSFWDRIKNRCENVGICGDLGNILFANESPENFLERYIEDICHVHVKDYLWKPTKVSPGKYWVPARDGSWLRDTMIGSGLVDFEVCMKILKAAGYEGAFALENGHPEPYEEGVRQAMEYLRRYW